MLLTIWFEQFVLTPEFREERLSTDFRSIPAAGVEALGEFPTCISAWSCGSCFSWRGEAERGKGRNQGLEAACKVKQRWEIVIAWVKSRLRVQSLPLDLIPE